VKQIDPVPSSVRTLSRWCQPRCRPGLPFEVHTVVPVTEFDAQELMTSAVGTKVSVMLVPSTLTTAIPWYRRLLHEPLGM